jgi:hypothetical protein
LVHFPQEKGSETMSGSLLRRESRIAAAAVLSAIGIAVLVLQGCPTSNSPGPAENLAISSGDGQGGAAGQPLAGALVVKVTDSASAAVPGITVSWGVGGGGGSISPKTSVTDSNGLASTTATLGASGANTFTGSVSGLTGSPATFSETAATTLAYSSGTSQRAPVGTSLGKPLIVFVSDTNGVPVADVTVTWAATAGGGSVSPMTSLSDASGYAQTTATVGSVAGSNTFTATVTGLSGSPVSFTATGY